MLPKKSRANKKTIEKIFKEGNFINSPTLSFKFVLNQNKKDPQISFIAPKSVAKLAVERNSLRRSGYLAFEKQTNILPRGLSGAFVFKKSESNIQILKNEIKTILHKIS
ncbi:MAG: ribonuclease P protein component [Candidatus Paceibacterota bacterium]|jgi:ribonuclease P protein component